MTAFFLFAIACIGVYWLITQRLHMNYFYPAPTVQFPNLVQPRPLSSITPGPGLPKLAGFAQTPIPKATVAGESMPKSVPKPHITFKPVLITAPTSPPFTPMPAPTYQAVTPMPMAHTPPPIAVPTFAPPPGIVPSPSPSPTRPGESGSTHP